MSRTTIKAGVANCEVCKQEAELRPYGPNNEWICYSCGQKDKATTERKMGEFLDKGLTLDITENGKRLP